MSNLNLLGKLRTKSSIATNTRKVYLPSMVTLGVLAALSPAVNAGSLIVDVDSRQNVSWKLTADEHNKKSENRDGSLRASELPINDSSTAYKLSNGYNSEKKEFIDSSTEFVHINGDNVGQPKGNTEAVFTYSADLGHNAVLEQISGDLSGEVNYASVNVTGNVSLARTVAADDYVGTYTLFARVKPKKDVLLASDNGDTGGLVPTDVITTNLNPGDSGVQELIGDEFIHAIEYGSWVMVTLKFEYRNAEEKLDIGGQFNVDWQGTVSVDGGGSFSNIENANTVGVSLEAYQFGGNALDLANILDVSVLECTLDNPQPCFNTFANTINYLRNDYPEQFHTTDPQTQQEILDLSKFEPVRYITASYKDSGPSLREYVEGPSQLSLASDIALRDAYSRWELAQMDLRRADYLLAERLAELSSGQQSKLNTLKSIANANISGLKNLIENCPNQGASACETQWNNQTFFNSYDRSVLDI